MLHRNFTSCFSYCYCPQEAGLVYHFPGCISVPFLEKRGNALTSASWETNSRLGDLFTEKNGNMKQPN